MRRIETRNKKRQRGQPVLSMETKLNISSWSGATKERTKRQQQTNKNKSNNDCKTRYEVAQSTVSKINKIITNLFTIGNNNNKTTTKKKKNNNLSSNQQQQQQQIKILEQNLQDKPRVGDNELRARRRKLGSNDGEIAGYVRTAAQWRLLAVFGGDSRRRSRTISSHSRNVDASLVHRTTRHHTQTARSSVASTSTDREESGMAQEFRAAMVRCRHLQSRRHWHAARIRRSNSLEIETNSNNNNNK